MAMIRRQALVVPIAVLLLGLPACRQETASTLPQTVPATAAPVFATARPASLIDSPLPTILPAEATAHERAIRAEQAAMRNSPRTPTQTPLPPPTQGETAGIVGFLGAGAVAALLLAALVAHGAMRGRS